MLDVPLVEQEELLHTRELRTRLPDFVQSRRRLFPSFSLLTFPPAADSVFPFFPFVKLSGILYTERRATAEWLRRSILRVIPPISLPVAGFIRRSGTTEFLARSGVSLQPPHPYYGK